MIVSIFKNIKETKNPYHKSIEYALNRIRDGSSKKYVEYLRGLSFKEYQEQKGNLPVICWQGKFTYRSAQSLEIFSGLIILDFDKFNSFEDAVIFKDSIIGDVFVFACWISPSGKGVKVLVKIPDDPENYKYYYKSLEKYFNHPKWDDKNSDLCRACFESYDPDIYINENSEIYISKEFEEFKDLGQSSVSIPVDSDSIIINNTITWFNNKYLMLKGQRNTNIWILACALNRFGVDKYSAKEQLFKYAQDDFTIEEIERQWDKAYKRVSEFKTAFYEDINIKKEIEKEIRNGKSKADIHKKFSNKSFDLIDNAIDNLKEEITENEFIHYSDKGKPSIIPHQYKFWLQNNSFLKYFPNNTSTFTFVKLERNLIEETNEKRIKDFVLDSLKDNKKYGYIPFDFMANNLKYFSSDFLSFLDSADVKLKEDTQTECFIYYANCVVKVTKDKREIIDYIDLDGYVWKRQIIDREYIESDHHKSVFREFLWLISGQEINRYNSLKSIIGYLLHSFKTSANNKAVILNDETISENPNGGSGKGIFWNAISKMKKVSSIDGKTFEFTKSFPYQTVSTDCQLLVFDDVKKNFNFESLFSLITEGITLEYKGQDAIKLPVEKSPKILITTNYTIKGDGGSFDRRKIEVELSNYFSSKLTPLDHFKHLLFDDWDAKEWSRFDNYMINCIEYYLQNGIVSNEYKNLLERKFISSTNHDFYLYTKEPDNLKLGTTYWNSDICSAIKAENPDYKDYSNRTILGWIKKYCEFKGYIFEEKKSGNARGFVITSKDYDSTSSQELFNDNENPF